MPNNHPKHPVRLIRALKIIKMSKDNPVTVKELSCKLNTTTRTIYRDISLIKDAGFKVKTSTGRGGGTWIEGI